MEPAATITAAAATSSNATAPPPPSARGGGGGGGRGGALLLSPGLGHDYTDVLITPTIPNEEMEMLLEFLKGS